MAMEHAMSRVGPDPVSHAEASIQVLMTYLWEWVRTVAQAPIPKASMTAMLALVADRAFPAAFLYLLLLWAIDFGLGVLRAVATPGEPLEIAKARRGLLRLLAIPLIVTAAAAIELLATETSRLFGADAAAAMSVGIEGKFVLLAIVAMAWEESISIQRNGRHFYQALRIRFTLPFRGRGEGGDP